MSDLQASTRLGEVLADKGVITLDQLESAVRIQAARRYLHSTNRVMTLGEILIELGYINRYQLLRGLNSQSYLRQLSMVVALCAPLMTLGCNDRHRVSVSTPLVTQVNNKRHHELLVTPPIEGPVDLSWNPPARRENGQAVGLAELAGYEIRYRLDEDLVYTHIQIPDPAITHYHFDWLEGSYEFQIAAYDISGIYSDFVPLYQASVLANA